MEEKISLVIPVFNAEKYIEKLLNKILSQTIVPDEIIAVDSQSDDKTVEICRKFDRVKVIGVKHTDYDYSGSCNKGILACAGSIVLTLSQDVMPIENDYIEKLIKPLFDDERIAACSGRQIAYEDASLREKLTRNFNYKSVSFVRDKSDLAELGIKAYFFSSSCSAYKKSALLKIGMFEEPSLACPDMIVASKLFDSGYRIAYAAEAKVYHSHDYSLKKQYARNFDSGADLAINSRYFGNVKAESEGIKMVKYVLKELLKKGHFIMAVYYCLDCAAKLFGHRAGKRYKKLSDKQILKRTANKNYWYRSGIIS